MNSAGKMNPLFIQGKCVNDCEVVLTVGHERTQLYVCIYQLAQMSDYFRVMFFGDFKEKKEKQFQITDERSEDMISFFNAISTDPYFRKITENSVELLIRLADKYQCDLLKECLKYHIEVNGANCESVSTILNWLSWCVKYNMPKEMIKVCVDILKMDDDSIELLMCRADEYDCDVLKTRLKQYIEVNEPNCKSASIILNWLIWSLQYHMPEEVTKMCLPGVACLSLSTLRDNQEKIGLKLYGKLLDIKMQLMCKTIVVLKESVALYSMSLDTFTCGNCGVKNHLPYKIRWCRRNISHTRFRCSSCRNSFIPGCCRGRFGVYYKCSLCTLDPSSYETKDQCLCARENFKMLLE